MKAVGVLRAPWRPHGKQTPVHMFQGGLASQTSQRSLHFFHSHQATASCSTPGSGVGGRKGGGLILYIHGMEEVIPSEKCVYVVVCVP